MNPYIPEGRAEYVKIDEEYTYSFDEGRVGLLKNGHWTSLNNGKAWIAAANEIEELRKQVANLHVAVEGAYKFANTLESEDDDANAWRLRDAMKDRS